MVTASLNLSPPSIEMVLSTEPNIDMAIMVSAKFIAVMRTYTMSWESERERLKENKVEREKRERGERE